MKLTAPVHWSVRLLVPAAVLVLGLGAIHYIGAFQGLFDRGTEAAISGGKAEARSHAAFVARQRQLAARAEGARAAARALEQDTSRLRARLDSALKAALAPLDTTHRIPVWGLFAACYDVRTNCEHRADSLAAADSTDKDRADRAEARAAHADSLLKPLTHAADCRWLGIGFMPKCLTRMQSYGAGALTVIVLKLTGVIK